MWCHPIPPPAFSDVFSAGFVCSVKGDLKTH